MKMKAAADKSAVQGGVWLLFDITMKTSGFNVDEPTLPAGYAHRMTLLSSGIDDDDAGLSVDDPLPLGEIEGVADEPPKAKELGDSNAATPARRRRARRH